MYIYLLMSVIKRISCNSFNFNTVQKGMTMIKSTKKIILSAAIIGIGAGSVSAQLTVDPTPTPAFLVTNVLLGTGISATGITYTGSAVARGSFNGTGSGIGFASGVLLTTGNVNTAIGPNDIGNAGTDLNLNGDPDLDIVSSNMTFDGAVLEFDFVPLADTLKFRYVFASEEYMEYVNASVNDAFGFFISGPGISGPYAGGAKNIALIPGTTTPVTIDNVNEITTPALYVNNEFPPGATIQYDGYTVPLTAISPVQCGETYHIKIAIADAGDGVWDSGVFLEAGSFSSVGVNIIPEISYGGANDSTLYEGCGNACIYFVRTSNLSTSDTIDITIGGTAVNGTDYYDNNAGPGALLPTQLVFAPGQDSIQYCINAVSDLATEGLESITLSIQPQGSALCVPPPTTATIYLNEYSLMALTVSDTTLCNFGGTVNIHSTLTGGVEPYMYTWTGGLPGIPDPTTTVSSTTSYVLTVSDACTGSPADPTPAVSDTATIIVATFDAMVVNAGSDQTVCPGDALSLSGTVTGGGSPYVYSWMTMMGTDTVASPNSINTLLMGNTSSSFMLTVMDVCGNTESDQVNVFVEPSCALNIPNVITPDGSGPMMNETFYVDNLDKFPNSKLTIYNRWGNKIYENANYDNKWNGSKYADGTYYYILTVPSSGQVMASLKTDKKYSDIATETEGDNKVFAGFFQIIRLK